MKDSATRRPVRDAYLYAAFDVERRVLHQPLDITQPVFERYRLHYEKQAASVVASLAAALLFSTARRLGASLTVSIIATLFFAFGTEMWVIGSQALWQHGSVNLILLAMIYALLTAGDQLDDIRCRRWLFAAGICAGFLPVVRPTAALFLIAASAFVAVSFRTRSWIFICGALIGLAPGVAWNFYFFNSFVGGYLGNTHNYVYSLSFACHALLGLLISPSKGLFITTPLVLFSILGALRAVRIKTSVGRLFLTLTVAALALVATYTLYIDWWGGSDFGDRFLTDTVAISALLLCFIIPARPIAYARSTSRALLISVVFVALLVISVGVQFVGANGEMQSEWSAVPNDVDNHTDRLWSWEDTQLHRDARATIRRFLPNETLSAAYAQGFNPDIMIIEPAQARPVAAIQGVRGKPLTINAVVDNRGPSPLFGYTTGYWIGQSRVRVQIETSAGAIISQQYMFLPGVYAAKARRSVTGDILMPAVPGVYKMGLDVIMNRIDDTQKRPKHPTLLVLTVR